MRQLPGFYWDEEKKRYFPESSRPKQKDVSPYDVGEEYHSHFGRRNVFKMKIERSQPVHLPFTGPVTVSDEFVFACSDGFNIKKYAIAEGKLVLKDEVRSMKQIKSLYCTESYLLVILVPQDLDASSTEACLYRTDNLNSIKMIEILNYPFKKPILEIGAEVAYISGASELIFGDKNLGEINHPRTLFHHPNVGITVATTNGKIQIFEGPNSDNLIKLEHSSATELFYSGVLGSILALTFHGDLIRIDLESKEQSVLATKLPSHLLHDSYIIFAEDRKVRCLNLLNATESFSIELSQPATQIFLKDMQLLYK